MFSLCGAPLTELEGVLSPDGIVRVVESFLWIDVDVSRGLPAVCMTGGLYICWTLCSWWTLGCAI